MFQSGQFSDRDICNKLRSQIVTSNIRIKQTEENLKKKAGYEATQDILSNAIKESEAKISFVRENIKLLTQYIKKKKEKAIRGVLTSIDNTNQIVSSRSNLNLHIGDNEVYLEGQYGEDVDTCEASSWRAMTSVQIRHAILSNTEYCKDMILDEPLAVLDDYSSADFSEFLPILARDRLIILIEQKDSIFGNAQTMTYRLELHNGITTIKKEGGEV